MYTGWTDVCWQWTAVSCLVKTWRDEEVAVEAKSGHILHILQAPRTYLKDFDNTESLQ